jgi:hypothetical protein
LSVRPIVGAVSAFREEEDFRAIEAPAWRSGVGVDPERPLD